MTTRLLDMSAAQMVSIQNQQQNIAQDRRWVLVASTWPVWILATVAIGLRFYSKRILMHEKLRLEDALIALGLVATTGQCIILTIGVAYGFGIHTIRLTPVDFVMLIKLSYGFQIVYVTAIVSIKSSVLIFYHRTFVPYLGFRIAIWAMAAFVICWGIAVTTTVIFQCTPVNFTWDKTIPGGHCINFEKFIFSTALINILTDFAIVVMPVPIIMKLHMPMVKKVGVCGIFLLGGIVILASVLRLTTLHTVDTYDFAYDTVGPGVWSAVEPLVGIIGACLPIMTPIFRKVKEISLRKSSGGSGDSGSGSGSGSGGGGRHLHPVILEEGQRIPADEQYGFKDDLTSTSHRELTDGGSSDHDLIPPQPAKRPGAVDMQPEMRQGPITREMDFKVEAMHAR